MTFRHLAYRAWLPALVASACLVSWGVAQDHGRQPRPPYRVAGHATNGDIVRSAVEPVLQPNEHPLMPAIRWAREGLHNIRQIQDYSAVMVKRERVDGKLKDEEYMFIKVRHRPMSVYMYFLKPESLQGQEVIWVEGRNNGKMWAHGTGLKSVVGTVSLSPTSPFAMDGNRYPITEIGVLNLVQRLLEVAERDARKGECEVKFFPGAKINERVCTCIQVTHPVPRRDFLFHVARIFVDDELNVPIRYEAYDWPSEPGGPPVPMEQYTYLNLSLNNGFTDADFDIRNPRYGFNSQ